MFGNKIRVFYVFNQNLRVPNLLTKASRWSQLCSCAQREDQLSSGQQELWSELLQVHSLHSLPLWSNCSQKDLLLMVRQTLAKTFDLVRLVSTLSSCTSGHPLVWKHTSFPLLSCVSSVFYVKFCAFGFRQWQWGQHFAADQKQNFVLSDVWGLSTKQVDFESCSCLRTREEERETISGTLMHWPALEQNNSAFRHQTSRISPCRQRKRTEKKLASEQRYPLPTDFFQQPNK